MKRPLWIGSLCAATLALATVSAHAALIARGGGLIYDDVLDVTWLQDANYAKTNGNDADGLMTWLQATTWAANLTYYDAVRDVTYDDWRLPSVSPVNGISFDTTVTTDGTTDKGTATTTTDGSDGGWRDASGNPVSEMGHMYYVNLANLGACDTTLPYCTAQPGGGLSNTGPFVNLETSEDYWSGTALNDSQAWYFVFVGGTQFEISKDFPRFAWAVRDGDVGAEPPPPPPPPKQIMIDVPYASSRPSIDGTLDYGEWDVAERLSLDNGFMAFAYDRERLYVLIDVLADDGDDPFVNGGGDQFWLYFDVDEDAAITPDVDLRFRLESGTGNLRYETFCEDCLFGFNSPEPQTFSARGEGFGCFFEDGSIELLPLRCNAHRVWELAVDLDEIGLRSDMTARFGYLVSSVLPQLTENHPPNINDLADYGQLTLASSAPRNLSTSGPGAMDPSFEVTQGIQTPRNALDLAAGKRTVVRIWDASNDSPVLNWIYGSRGGVDLPGSPLLSARALSSDYVANPRDSIVWNSFSTLPADWAAGGEIDFEVVVQGYDESIAATLDARVDFAPTWRPVFWTVPIRNNFPEGAFTLVNANRMTTAEQGLRADAPVEEIEIVRRPILDVLNVSSSADLKAELKTYDQQVILAWTLGLVLTGQPPFALPEQITGFIANGFGTTAGSSDRVGRGGAGRISWVSPSASASSLTYPHELNHNLDRAQTSTWGLHSRGCNAASGGALDPSWPYGNSFRIQEVGVRWTGTQFTSVPDQTPDFMSYCFASSSSGKPRQWFSPYRWQAWVDNFRTDRAAATASSDRWLAGRVSAPVDSFYVLGRIYADGSGELGQVLRQPGLPARQAGSGEYAVRVVDCAGGTLSAEGLTPSFTDEHGETLPYAAFSAILGAPQSACAIELEHAGAVLARRPLSASAPFVSLNSPNGGELWSSGTQSVSWQAGDADGDPLLFTLLYSPDGGMTWQPIATTINADHYGVDASSLPGSDDARIRVLASDGTHTSADDSDMSFTVAARPPAVEIVSPADNAVVQARDPLVLEGLARDTFGNALAGERLTWEIDGEVVGRGAPVRVHLDPADHEIRLTAEGPDGAAATTSVWVTAADLDGIEDGTDVARAPLDVSSVRTVVDGEQLTCEIVVRSGAEGLIQKSRFACHLDFDDAEDEATSSCDADGDGALDGTYRLGSNGRCSTSDVELSYLQGRTGGSCAAGPGVRCWTEETADDGASDAECDGVVGGRPAAACLIRMSAPLSTIAARRDAQCGGADECLGGVDARTGAYRAYAFFEARLGKFSDQVPNTNDRELPDAVQEVLVLPLSR